VRVRVVVVGSYFHRGESGSRCLMTRKYHGHGQTGNLRIPKKNLLFTGRCHLAAAAAFAPCAFGCFGARTQLRGNALGGRRTSRETSDMDALMHDGIAGNGSDDGSELAYHSITGRP
jgi:hypothetical protein